MVTLAPVFSGLRLCSWNRLKRFMVEDVEITNAITIISFGLL